MFQYKKDSVLFTMEPSKGSPYGWYDEANNTIYINKHLSEIDREIVYFHERQHRKCKKEVCTCYSKPTDFWCEYHAMKVEFEDCVKSGPKFIARYKVLFRESLEVYKSDLKVWGAHYRASMKLLSLKKFREVIL